jgi:ketosteroid isomerase-like protein
MSQGNVELVRRMLEAYATGTAEQALEFFDPHVEYDVTARPDGKVWHGREGVRRAIEEWTGAWEAWEMRIERCLDLGDDRVLVLWNERGRAGGSGVALTEEGVSVFTLREGMIVRVDVRLDRRRTLEALGLRADGATRAQGG